MRCDAPFFLALLLLDLSICAGDTSVDFHGHASTKRLQPLRGRDFPGVSAVKRSVTSGRVATAKYQGECVSRW